MRKIITSDAFQYSLLMALLSMIAVAFASIGAYFLGDYSGMEAMGTFFIAMIPQLGRLKEGIADHLKKPTEEPHA